MVPLGKEANLYPNWGGFAVLDRHWDDLKRLAPFASALLARNWWALVVVVTILVAAVIWLSRNPETDEVETPILTWRRRRSRPP